MDILTARTKTIEYGLTGPDWALDPTTPILLIKRKIGSSGGCGPGKFGNMLVPDRIWFVNIKPACYCHDCRYHDLEDNVDTTDERYKADKELFNNGEKIIRKESKNKFTRWLRMRVLLHYYMAVDVAGHKWKGDDA